MAAIATIASGHDPAYYTQAAKGPEYYSSAAGKSGMEPAGTWTGAGCPELGLAAGAAVDPGVFVPRRRTEFLVEQAAGLMPPGGVAVDLCCGSGALGAALAARVRLGELHATDIDQAAVRCAAANLAAIGGLTYQGDLYEPLPPALHGRVDILLANVPYVPASEVALLPAEARLHEARVALDGGADGLDVARRVVAGAPRWLAPGGHLLIETSERQAAAAVAAFAEAGLDARLAACDEYAATVVIGASRDELAQPVS